MKFQRLGDWIIVVTRVGCYQASVARGLLDHGVEVPVVAGHEKNEVRVNTRATGQLVRNSSLHLGEDAAMPLARAFGGSGGGHSTSPGANISGNLGNILEEAFKLIGDKATHL